MKTRHYVIIAFVLVILIIVGLCLRGSAEDGDNLGDIDWRSFDCKNDADRPYISILRDMRGEFDLTILVPYCSGNMEFTSAGLNGGVYTVIFTATSGPKATKKKMLVHKIDDIPTTAEVVTVEVTGGGVDESTTVVTSDADDESSGIPMDEVLAMHYDPAHSELCGFVYGTNRYDPTPDSSWVRYSMPVELLDTLPAARTTFIRIPVEDPAQVEATYKAWLKFADGAHGRSFSFQPVAQE